MKKRIILLAAVLAAMTGVSAQNLSLQGDPGYLYMDGAYGLMPQGMSFPVTWMAVVRNNGTQTATNATATISNAPLNGNYFVAMSGTPYSVPAGNSDYYFLYIDERGFYNGPRSLDATSFAAGTWLDSLGIFTNSENYGNQGYLSGGYMGRGLNTQTQGLNYVAAKIEYGNNSTILMDTLSYIVTTSEEFDNLNRVDGYRWGHDNGVLTSGNAFTAGFNAAGTAIVGASEGSLYNKAGHSVSVRYTTGCEVPEDWVIRGAELVIAPEIGSLAVGTQIEVFLLTDEPDGTTHRMATGNSSVVYTVTSADVESFTTGYRLPNSNYKALDVRFPNEVRLQKNRSYRIGYRLVNDGNFALAGSSEMYNSEGDRMSLHENPVTAPYANSVSGGIMGFVPHNVIVSDQTNAGFKSTYVTEEDGYYPMMRLIVGTPSPIEMRDVVLLESNSCRMIIGGEDMHADLEPAGLAVGGVFDVEFWPIDCHHVLDSIKLNGTLLTNLTTLTREVYDSATGSYVQKTGYRTMLTISGSIEYYAFSVVSHGEVFYTVEVHSNDLEAGLVSGGGIFHANDTAMLAAYAQSGSTFESWSNGETANPLQVVVNSDTSLVAIFSRANCFISSFPYVMDFENNHSCWTTLDMNQDTSGWRFGSIYGQSSCAYIDSYENVDDWLIMPTVMASGNFTLSWRSLSYSLNSVAYQVLRVNQDDVVDTLYSEPIWTPAGEELYFVNRTTSFNVPAGETSRIVFRSNSQNILMIDDVVLNHEEDTVFVHDTVTTTIHDTVTVTITVHDTITNTIYDTVTITDTLWMTRYDTVYIHDTVYVGIDEVEMPDAKIYQRDGRIVVEGAEGNIVVMYDVDGRMLATKKDEFAPLLFDVPVTGAYLVKIGNHPARKIVVIR